jgi:hypothetical protein
LSPLTSCPLGSAAAAERASLAGAGDVASTWIWPVPFPQAFGWLTAQPPTWMR